MGCAQAPDKSWDTFSDTWVATDNLGRRVVMHDEVGNPREGKFVAIFYFLWLGEHETGGPWDVTKILQKDPDAMQKKDSPLWGPMYAAHHWGESIFGYYRTDDEYVLRKHAQMLSDAGVDVVVFDVTNQVTYKRWYMELLRVWSQVRAEGGKTPQVAFLCPFWDPPKVVNELFTDLYEPGLYSDLWFKWDGKPLILADPGKISRYEGINNGETPVQLEPAKTLGQSFTATKPFDSVSICIPTWTTKDAAATITLRKDGPEGEIIVSQRFENIPDCEWLGPKLQGIQPEGEYYIEMSEVKGQAGWWTFAQDVLPAGQAYADRIPTTGDRSVRYSAYNPREKRIAQFFTFRKPQASYFQGPTGPDQWSWLEVYPQHVFLNSKGEKEQMSVGVGQNAVNGRLGSMSEKDALGRSYTGQKGYIRTPDAVNHGYNVTEQWERALAEDPTLIWVTGWNEWIMGRFDEFAGVREPVMFVDQYDQEHSRDIEPMKGGHGDNYYYQLVSNIRKFKGAHPMPVASPEKTIRLRGNFNQWTNVKPEFRDAIGDPSFRDEMGYNNCEHYTNNTGRNDLVLMKVARDAQNIYFYAKTRDNLSPWSDPQWMMLLIDADCDHATGWEGYDFIINHTVKGPETTVLEANTGGWNWKPVTELTLCQQDNELMISVPRELLGIKPGCDNFNLDFKWADNPKCIGDISAFTLNGDCAPPGRFNFRYCVK